MQWVDCQAINCEANQIATPSHHDGEDWVLCNHLQQVIHYSEFGYFGNRPTMELICFAGLVPETCN